ncbi:MAG TPA: CoA transferase, partial [Acetobacteraceae bacterium]
FFHATNRGTTSVVLDIKDAGDVARLKGLAREADSVIQTLRGGIVEAAGIGPDALMAANPRLIYCNISAFGHQGPLRHAPGFDPLLQAYAGIMAQTGRPEDPPTFCAPAINDKATGMWCVIGALAALQRRHATGQGCVIDTSLFDSAVGWMASVINGYKHTGQVPARHGTASNTLTPYQAFPTADRPIVIAAGNDRLFVKLAAVMGRPEWSADPRFINGPTRGENRLALVALMEEILVTRPRDHWMRSLEAVGVPCAPVNSIAELAETEQFAAADLLRGLPGTDLQVIGLPIAFDRQRPHPIADSPRLGAHTAEVPGIPVT